MSMINRTVTENELFSRLAKYTRALRLGRVRAVVKIFGSAQGVASSRVTSATNAFVRQTCLTNC
jgi:hypothetical protein